MRRPARRRTAHRRCPLRRSPAAIADELRDLLEKIYIGTTKGRNQARPKKNTPPCGPCTVTGTSGRQRAVLGTYIIVVYEAIDSDTIVRITAYELGEPP